MYYFTVVFQMLPLVAPVTYVDEKYQDDQHFPESETSFLYFLFFLAELDF